MGKDFTAKDFRTWGATLHASGAARSNTPGCCDQRNCREEDDLCSGQAGRRGTAQYTCRVPQVLYQPDCVRRMRSGHIHEIIDGKLTLASARKAETLVLAFLRQEGGDRRVNRAASILYSAAGMPDRRMSP